jgi:hypothetical protein
MKKNLILVAITGFIIAFSNITNAQSWTLSGNNNATSSSKLGTKKALPLKVITNDTVRFYISKFGHVSIGAGSTADPDYQLYVKGKSYGIKSEGGIYGVRSDGGSYGLYATSTNGFGGIATSTNSDGFDAYSTNGFYGIYSSCSNTSGVGVYGYGGKTGSYGYGGTFGVSGYSSGGYGVYGQSYNGYSVYGENTKGYAAGYFHSVDGYGIGAASDNAAYAGVFFGSVYTSGSYATSDKNLKNNIEDFSSAMSIINKLKPKFYDFKTDAKYKSLHLPNGKHYGLLAQDIEQVLPGLVKEENFHIPVTNNNDVIHPKNADGKDINNYTAAAVVPQTETIDVKAVNYLELIPIMIKAMQEQDKKIDALTQQVNALISGQSTTANNVTSVQLKDLFVQSIPNPAKNTASIVYNNLPVNSKAQLSVSDAGGKLVKQVQLNKSGSGVVNMDVSALSAGTYFYSIFINGKLTDTKKMEVVK